MSLVIANPRKRTYIDPFTLIMNDVFQQPRQHKLNHPQKTNVAEFEDRYELEIAAPGYGKDNLSVTVEDNTLVVAAKVEEQKKDEGNNFRQKEFSIHSFSRSFILNDDIDQSAISAQFENGILKVNVPKKEEAKVQPKKLIEIS
ncbi:MAG: Hsp20/alpha crystallin family protein [Saprospiraceae bacterium]|nr:Hsp20/alpha crystallin family protein [Saprospiraceae bacterium]